jgi:hypothetical protein
VQRFRAARAEETLAAQSLGQGFLTANPRAFVRKGRLWMPSSRLIEGANEVMDLAQIELVKRWRFLTGSARSIKGISVGSGFPAITRADTAMATPLDTADVDSWDDTLISPDSTNLSEVLARKLWLSQDANGIISEIGLIFDDASLVTHANFGKSTITGATQANPVRITTSVAHGLATGDEVHIDNVVGMTEINNREFTITVFDADEYDLDGEDGTGHTAYSSAGDAWLIVVKDSLEVVQTDYKITLSS